MSEFSDTYSSDVPGVFESDLRLPFIEGMPSLVKVKEMRKWLNQHSDLYRNESVVLYHATGVNIPVLEEGLKPTSLTRRRSYQSASGYVYLANTPERAKAFGDMGNQGRSRVYAVRVLVRRLKADLDQLSNQRSVGKEVGNSLAESIIYGGGARYKGAIGPWDVREVFIGPNGRFVASPATPEVDVAVRVDTTTEGALRAVDLIEAGNCAGLKKRKSKPA